MTTTKLTSENLESTIRSHDIVLVDFWASWCGPCMQFGPVYEDVAERNPDVVFGKVNVDEQTQIAQAAGIYSIPTLMAFRGGVAVFRQAGALPSRALEDVLRQVRELDMDTVRAQIARDERRAQSDDQAQPAPSQQG